MLQSSRRNRFSSFLQNKRRLRFLRIGWLETLEERHLLASFVVNSTLDLSDSGHVPAICDTELIPGVETPVVPASGICTLRAAIESSNETPEADTITFNLSPNAEIMIAEQLGVTGTIQLLGPVEGVRITNSEPIDATAGIALFGSGGSELRNLVINGFAEAIRLGSDNNVVAGNRIGVNAAGTSAIGNQVGIVVEGNHNLIGGPSEADRNIISGNESGIVIVSRTTVVEPLLNNHVQGNYIGTDVTGTLPIGNSLVGVRLSRGATDNIVGGPGLAGNLISSNGYGVLLDLAANGNYVVGNFIGTDISGTAPLGNVDGVFIVGAPNNYVGGTLPGSSEVLGNLISGSIGNFAAGTFGAGVLIGGPGANGNLVQGNRIGTNYNGTIAIPNAGDGVTINRASDNIIGGLLAEQRNLISGNNGDGIAISGGPDVPANSNLVLGNYIGTDETGMAALQNRFRGVHIDQHSTFNIVGGTTESERNIISGNRRDGVIIALPSSSSNRVIGNYIGTNKDGLASVPNLGNGVLLFDAPDNQIGGSSVGEGNVISGNAQSGVRIERIFATNNFVQGNFIGTDKNGAQPLGNQSAGVLITGASSNHIGGQQMGEQFVTGNTISANEHGVHILGPQASNNEVLGNLIGTGSSGSVIDPDGNPNNGNGLGNRQAGVYIENASANRIGLGIAEAILPANIIAGNNDGVIIRGALATANLIGNNFIGVDGLGKNPLGNRDTGVFIDAAKDNVIGGFKTGQPLVPGNTISANGNGVLIVGAQATGNVVAANKIGTDLDGIISDPASLLGNLGDGVFIQDASENFIGQSTDGGEVCNPTAFPLNVIGGNQRAGVRIEGADAQANLVRCNSIFNNEGIGIDLGADGVTPNDPLDSDDGPNRLQNFPIIAVLEQVEDIFRVSGTLMGAPSSVYHIDFYATETSTAQKLEHGIQGKRYLGSHSVTTDDNGDVHFETAAFQLLSLEEHEVVTATATDLTGNTSEFSNFTPDFVANGVPIRTPVLFVPGFFGSFVPEITNDATAYGLFLLRLGIDPSLLVLDPILKGYDDFIASLQKAGYIKDRDLFLAPYDWRLPLAPPGDAVNRDGRIDGLTASQIIDDNYEYGIDYLGHWLKKAAEQFYAIHRQPLTNVHIVAHSMGGLLSRSYIQSSAYSESFTSAVRTDGGKLALPMVNQLTMLGVPNRGSAVTFPTWADNYGGELAYRIVLSKIVAQAWKLLQRGNIQGIDRSTFNFNATGLALHEEKVKFVRQYVRGMGDLLPEYPNYAVNFTPTTEFENKLLLDLNQTVRSSHRVARTVVMFGASKSTPTAVKEFTGPLASNNASVLSFTDLSFRVPESGLDWYLALALPTHGDGTVPLESLSDLFAFDQDVERIAFCTNRECQGGSGNTVTGDGVAHTDIVANRDVQLNILKKLGHPLLFSQISTGKQTTKSFQIKEAAVPFNAINYYLDPVDALLIDSEGNRLGFTESTGPLNEIPGSTWFGGRIGIGWILDEPVNGPLELQLFGLGEDYAVQVSNSLGQVLDGQDYSGFLATGETTSDLIPVIRVGAFVTDNTLYYFTAPGAENSLRMTTSGQMTTLTEMTGINIATGAQCASDASGETATCDLSGVTSVHLAMGDLHDNIDIIEFGLPGTINTAIGDDTLRLNSAVPDAKFNGGPGRDAVVITGNGIHLNLMADTQLQLQDIEVIDLAGNGPNVLTLNPTALRTITDSAQSLMLRHDADDTIHYINDWTIDSPVFINNEATHIVRGEDAELQVVNTTPWQNPLNRLDTNLNNSVSPIDALLIINSLNRHGPRPLPIPTATHELPAAYLDTSGNNYVSALDALLVVNLLNNRNRGLASAEGEGNDATAASDLYSLLTASSLDAYLMALPIPSPQLQFGWTQDVMPDSISIRIEDYLYPSEEGVGLSPMAQRIDLGLISLANAIPEWPPGVHTAIQGIDRSRQLFARLAVRNCASNNLDTFLYEDSLQLVAEDVSTARRATYHCK